MSRDKLTNFINGLLPLWLTKFANHEAVRRRAVNYLLENGLYPIFPKRYTDDLSKEKLQIDLVGWSKHKQDVIGIDAKTTPSDFKKFKDKNLNRYLNYCNKLYIVTNNIDVEKDARNYCNKNGYLFGLLFFDDEEKKLTPIWHPVERDVTEQMTRFAQEVMKEYLARSISNADLSQFNNAEDAINYLKRLLDS